MRTRIYFAAVASLAMLFLPAVLCAQDKNTEHGYVDFGVRYVTGYVYGRQDLQTGQCLGCGSPFHPELTTSKFNEYGDFVNGFYVRSADLKYDHLLGSKNYFNFQAQSAVYRDQSYLATFGQYGKFKLQFRYDEIPHTYTNTTRTLFTQTAPGVWSFPTLLRQTLQATTAANLPSVINTMLVQQAGFITPETVRKAGSLLFAYNLTENWSVNASFRRENESGLRPIGTIMNSSPSASASSGYGAELPEFINYYINTVKVGTEYGQKRWGVQADYIGSFFQNDTPSMSWTNPFRLTTEQITNPLTGRMSLYPSNHANYLDFAGATDLGKFLHVTASITPGWLRQDQAFIPYTSNTAILTCGTGTQDCTSLATLPAASLTGSKQTLAMNYTAVTTTWKNLEGKVNYRQYDYNNNTPVNTFTPVEGDAAAAVQPGIQNTLYGFNRKDLEVSGNWYFAKKSSFKAGYQGEWMDRTNRDAEHSLDNSFFTSVDYVPIKDLLVRVSYRYSDRKPDAYQDDQASDPVTGLPVLCTDTTTVTFTADQRCHRRFDEAARIQNQGAFLVQYNMTDKLTVSAFGGTLQNNYNLASGTNSPTGLNFLTGAAATAAPYYLYGVQKDISFNYGFDADYAISQLVTLFAEYSYELYNKRMITRYRTPPGAGLTILTCSGCDTPNNDWESVAREPVNIYTVGADWYFGKRYYLSTYYSLSASRGNVNSWYLGDPTISAAGQNQFLLSGTNAAVSYPETTNRMHDVVVMFKFNITKNLVPRVEYRYQQWDNLDYQTSVMTQYMGCVSPIPNGPPVTNTVPGCTTPILLTNTANPLPGGASAYYPGYVVGDPSSARYLFLGVDQPSYHAHSLTATLEYHF